MESFYRKLQNKRKSWEVISPTDCLPRVPQAIDLLSRCLSLRVLEIPVGEFIESALRSDLPQENRDDLVSLLRLNVEDEDKHDRVLNAAASNFSWYNSSHETVANQLLDRWMNLPDNPLHIAQVLETSLFFVILPIFRDFGNSGLATISNDISNDERLHVAVNTHVVGKMGWKMSRKMGRLRVETIEWMLGDEREWETYPQFFSEVRKNAGLRNTWRKSSDNLLDKGQAPLLKHTSYTPWFAMFENAGADGGAYKRMTTPV